jgi:hypothetical protein
MWNHCNHLGLLTMYQGCLLKLEKNLWVLRIQIKIFLSYSSKTEQRPRGENAQVTNDCSNNCLARTMQEKSSALSLSLFFFFPLATVNRTSNYALETSFS